MGEQKEENLQKIGISGRSSLGTSMGKLDITVRV